MLALSQSKLPDPQSVCRAYAKSFPKLGKLVFAPDSPGASESDLLSFSTPTCNFAVALVRAPIPWSDLRDPCAAAWYWPEAEQTLKQHRGHLLITASVIGSNNVDAIELMLALTRVLAAVAQCSPALGVYLGGAKQVHKVDDFVGEAEGATREMLPLYLWVRFSITQESDHTFTLCTTGLGDLELMELEFHRVSLDAQTLMDRAFNIAHYLLDHGAVLADGHTIGVSADEKFTVNHAPSLRDAGALVYRLTQGAKDKGIPS
jgi:hypothetical protein